MIKNIFHKNSIKIFSALEYIGLTKITRSILTKKLNNNLNIPLPLFMFTTPELHKSNDWYGHASALKKYAGLPNEYSIKAAIEHGPFFGRFIWPQDLNNSLPVMITFSKDRAEFLRKKTNEQVLSFRNKKIFSIGPYIYYANHYLTRIQLQKERKRLGKNLLVFPIHETNLTRLDYDIEQFCQEIKKVGKKFDSIRICLYWKDLLSKRDKLYKKHGFEIVTAGHIFDPIFLSRLKSIIELSTATMSNGIGTHIGYSIFMKKPHHFLLQKIQFRKLNIDAKRALSIEKDTTYRQIIKALLANSNNITSQQYNLISSFFGFDQIKSKKQLAKILFESENLWQKIGS